MDQAFASADCRPRPKMESNSIFQLAFHVMSGDVATIVPGNFTQANNAFKGTREKVLCSPTISQKIGLVWAKGTPIQPMAKATVDLMQEAVSGGQLPTIFGT